MADGGLVWLCFPLAFVGMWVTVSLIVSRTGGWHDLAGEYRAAHAFLGGKFHWRSAGMRASTWYRSCLTMGSDQQGLSLAASPLFRVGHPPLFIPWSDISVSPEKVLWWDYARLSFRRCPDIPFRIRRKLAAQLLARGPLRFEAA